MVKYVLFSILLIAFPPCFSADYDENLSVEYLA